MNRRVLGVLGLLILTALALWIGGGASRRSGVPTGREEMPAASRVALGRERAPDAAAGVRTAVERGPAGPAVIVAPTSLRVRYVAADSGAPIAGLGATLFEGTDPWGTARDATADADGVATWEDVPFDDVQLVPGGNAEPIRLEPGTVNERTIELARPLRVEGRVVDERGEPAGGALVWSYRGVRRRLAATRQAVVQADGKFAFTAYEVGGWAFVFATRDGCVSSRVVTPEWREDGRAAVVTLVVGGPAGDLAGTVFGPDGAPLPGALVTVLGTDARPPGDPDPVADAMGIARHAPPPSVRSAGDGRFMIRDVPPGRALLDVRCGGSAPGRERVAVRAGEIAEVVVRLVTGSVLRGTVRDAHGRVQRAVHIGFDADVQASTSSGADGTFELRDLPAGIWTVRARAAGGAGVTASVELPEGGVAEWNPSFPAGGRIAGTLRDPRGAPVDQVAVSVVGVEASWTWTDADGAFEFAEIPDGTYELRAQLRDGARAIVATGVAPGGGPVDARVPELPEPDASLSGRVLDAVGAPLEAVSVRGTHTELRATWSVRTAVDGSFATAGLRAGRWQVVVESGRHPAERFDVSVAPGAALDLGDLEIARPVPVEIRVATLPRPNTRLWAVLWGGSFEGAHCVVRGGRVELPPLRAGRYRLDVTGNEHARTAVVMVLEDGVPFARDIVLQDGVAHEVDVVLRDDEEQVQILEFATFDGAGRELLRWKDVWNAARGQTIAFRLDARRVTVTTADGRRADAAIDGSSLRLDLR